jgi:hypothetical protein
LVALKILVCQKSVQVLYGQRVIHLVARADPLTGVMTHASAHARKGVILLEQCQGLTVFTLLDQGDEALYAHMGRAAGSARSRASFFDGKGPGNGLGVLFEHRFFDRKAFVVAVFQLYRADLGTFATARALGHVDISGIFMDVGGKPTRFPGEFVKFTVGDKLYVQMPADLDQFGRDDSHGTVIGGKGFIQLRHQTANGGRLLQQIDIVSGIGQIQGRLHSGNAAADNHDRSHKTVLLSI